MALTVTVNADTPPGKQDGVLRRCIAFQNSAGNEYNISCELFPRNVSWGDYIYLNIYVENAGYRPLFTDVEDSNLGRMLFLIPAISGMNYEIKSTFPNSIIYTEKEEHLSPDFICIDGGYLGPPTLQTPVLPGHRRLIVKHRFELFPLEYIEQYKPEFAPQNGFQVNYEIAARIGSLVCQRGENSVKLFNFPLFFQPRREYETELLKKWFHNTPVILRPRISHNGIYICPFLEKEDFDKYNNLNRIAIGGDLINMSAFLPSWNCRKPGYPNAPTTIQGWRDLEKSLVESTMRDEIQMTRMLLEYYDATGDAQDKKLAEIKAWLESLPPVQASILARYYDAPEDSPLYDAAQKLKPIIEKQLEVSSQQLVEKTVPS